MKLIMVDLDGTLFDTREVNFRAYKEAIEKYGFCIEYDYYCEYCNGRYYMDFLPEITTYDQDILSDIHKRKKKVYKKYLSYAKINHSLVEIINICKGKCKIALVTTASRENTNDILDEYNIRDLFDLILTHEDIEKSKPNPESFIKAMNYFDILPEEAVVFEDSSVGVKAAEASGATVFIVKGYN